jgi:hypothetical protein
MHMRRTIKMITSGQRRNYRQNPCSKSRNALSGRFQDRMKKPKLNSAPRIILRRHRGLFSRRLCDIMSRIIIIYRKEAVPQTNLMYLQLTYLNDTLNYWFSFSYGWKLLKESYRDWFLLLRLHPLCLSLLYEASSSVRITGAFDVGRVGSVEVGCGEGQHTIGTRASNPHITGRFPFLSSSTAT